MVVVDRLIGLMCRLLELAIALLLATMVVLVFGNVVARYGFNSGITLSEELSRWMFIWLTFLGAVIALKERGHLGMDMVVSKLPKAGKKICLVTGQVLSLGIVWLILQGSWQQAVINAEVSAPVSGAPMAIVYAAGIVFAVLAGLIILLDLYRVLSMVRESEEAMQLEQILGDSAQGVTGKGT
jgi:TRAP-type C4-dicarboxylate transport system permease small subunit